MPRSGGPDNRERRRARRARGVIVAVVGVLAACAASAQDIADEVRVRLTPLAPLDLTDTVAPTSGDSPLAGETAPAPYEDQYLVGDGEREISIGSAARIEPFGQRRAAAELVYYRSDDDVLGRALEQGARLSWHREMSTWGIVDADVQLVDFDTDYLRRTATGTDATVTLRQSAMPVSEMAVLDTTVGHQRNHTRSLLHGGYRYRLPTTPMLGFSGDVAHPDMGIHFSTGKVGIYRGIALPRFEETGGHRTTLGYERRLGERLELGGELASITGDNDIRDHKSALLGARYTFPDDVQEHGARLLVDDAGNLGFWTDSRQRLGSNPMLRYGVFHFDADTVWADAPISDGQQGAYVRADMSRFRYNLSAGYDYLELGLGSATLSQSESHGTFLSGSMRVRRNLTLGANAELAARTFHGVLGDEQDLWRGTIFANFGIASGNLRLEAFMGELDSAIESNRRERDGLRAAFDWRMPERLRLTTELRHEQDRDSRGTNHRDELAALFHYDLLEDVSFGVNGSIYTRRHDASGQDDGVMLSADLRWKFLPSWYATASLSRNRAQLELIDFGFPSAFGTPSPERRASDSLWITIGHVRSAGRPFPLFGQAQAGRAGTGSVVGEVFFDENRDGIRQPSEQVAAGAVVVLDGRYETRTDDQGRYEFAPVPTGPHEVTVVTEELPLPWGLDDESPVRIHVGFRDTARVEFPLLALN